MFHCEIFSKEEIQANLSLVRTVPFIDDGIVIDCIPPYSVDFGFGDEKWEEFCPQNKEVFKVKLNKILEEITPVGR